MRIENLCKQYLALTNKLKLMILLYNYSHDEDIRLEALILTEQCKHIEEELKR